MEVQEVYSFKDPGKETLFYKVIHELRCSVCQNQALSDSMAPLAVDLRQEIYQRVEKNATEEEILQFVVDRYGDFVLYNPPLHLGTSLLWFGPLLILIIGISILIKSLKNHSSP